MAWRVLLVEDDPLTRRGLGRLLQIEGYSVQVADNGKSARSLLDHSEFDAVVTDFHLGDEASSASGFAGGRAGRNRLRIRSVSLALDAANDRDHPGLLFDFQRIYDALYAAHVPSELNRLLSCIERFDRSGQVDGAAIRYDFHPA